MTTTTTSTISTPQSTGPSTRAATVGRARRLRRLLTALAAAAATILGIAVAATPASASTLPYATAGSRYCLDGLTISPGLVRGTNPNYLYPANPTLARSYPGELDYYRVDLMKWNGSYWQVDTAGGWNPMYASYSWQGAADFPWSYANDVVDFQIYRSGVFALRYQIYWTPTGQTGYAWTGACSVNVPTDNGTWTMH